MTLEQAGRLAISDAAAGDLEGLRRALEARAGAVAEIQTEAQQAPSEDVRERLSAALDQGEAMAREIRALKLRMGAESARVARIQNGIAAGLGSIRPRVHIDVRL
jgi:hypothetical protein